MSTAIAAQSLPPLGAAPQVANKTLQQRQPSGLGKHGMQRSGPLPVYDDTGSGGEGMGVGGGVGGMSSLASFLEFQRSLSQRYVEERGGG